MKKDMVTNLPKIVLSNLGQIKKHFEIIIFNVSVLTPPALICFVWWCVPLEFLWYQCHLFRIRKNDVDFLHKKNMADTFPLFSKMCSISLKMNL